MITNFEYIGIWWDSSDIEMYRIGNKVFALSGWNGEKYTDSWECIGDSYMDTEKEVYEIIPYYEENDGDFELIGFKVNEK